MKRLYKKEVIRNKFAEWGIDLFGNKVYDLINEIVADDRKAVATAIRFDAMEEREDFVEDGAELTDFQQGVLYGMKLAAVKVEGYAKEGFNND